MERGSHPVLPVTRAPGGTLIASGVEQDAGELAACGVEHGRVGKAVGVPQARGPRPRPGGASAGEPRDPPAAAVTVECCHVRVAEHLDAVDVGDEAVEEVLVVAHVVLRMPGSPRRAKSSTSADSARRTVGRQSPG